MSRLIGRYLLLLVCIVIVNVSYGEKSSEVKDTISNSNQKQNSFGIDMTNSNQGLAGANLPRLSRYADYQNNHFTIINLVNQAKQAGITVSPDELSEYSKAYNQLFPDIPMINIEWARDEIMVQKYFERIAGAEIGKEDIQKASNSFIVDIKSPNTTAVSEIMPILKTKALLSKAIVQEKISQEQEQFEKASVQTMQTTLVFWPADSMRIQSDDSICIAIHPDSANCLISCARYNNGLRFYPVLKRIPLDSARLKVLKSMLTDLYIADLAKSNGFATSDSAESLKNKWIYASKQMEQHFKLGRTVTDPYLLRRVYEKYYNFYFKQYYEYYISILGSSDSACIDSLRNVAIEFRNKNGRITNGSDDLMQSKLPWQRSTADSLPSELVKAADSLCMGCISEPIRTAYGWFIVRPDSSIFHPETNFEDAKARLIALATREKWLNVDSLIEEQAYGLYKKYQKTSYVIPDTQSLIVWLFPGGKDAFVRKREIASQMRKYNRLFHSNMNVNGIDTVKLSSLKITSLQLPVEIQANMRAVGVHIPKKDSLFGPFFTRYGTYLIKIHAVKRGGAPVSYASVKRYLCDSLLAATTDTVRYTAKENDALNEIALARVYTSRLFWQAIRKNGTGSITDYDNGNDDTLGQKNTFKAAFNLRQKCYDDIKQWIKKLTINSNLLINRK